MPSAIYVNGNVVTMDAEGTTGQAVAVAGGTIVRVGTNEEIQCLAPAGTPSTDLQGSDGAAPGDSRCTTPDDPQQCFIPVRNQDDVVARLRQRLAQAQANPSEIPYVLAANYDVSRLGRSSTCSSPDELGFECPNFEDGYAREQLDAISPDVPIVVTAQSGHFVYVNTPALALLNICGTPGANDQCYKAVVNPEPETALANRGQLDENLAQYAGNRNPTGLGTVDTTISGNTAPGDALENARSPV